MYKEEERWENGKYKEAKRGEKGEEFREEERREKRHLEEEKKSFMYLKTNSSKKSMSIPLKHDR